MRQKRHWSWRAGALLLAAAGLAWCAGSWAQSPQRVLRAVRGTEAGTTAKGETSLPSGWAVVEGVSYENLTLFLIVARSAAGAGDYLTLDEGLASGEVAVTELGGGALRRSRDGRPMPAPQTTGPQVNRLVLVNRSTKPLLLLAGEVVSGGKQDRVIAKDRVVPPKSEPLPLDVFCVEHGRWTGVARFAGARMMVNQSVREKVAIQRRQDEVWAAIRNENTAAARAADAQPMAQPRITARGIGEVIASEAPSESYLVIYWKGRIGQDVEAFAAEVERRFARREAALKGEPIVGVITAYGGEVVWSDAFASPALFHKYWPKLLRSYAVEALMRPRTQEKASLEDAQEFLEPLHGRTSEESEPGIYRWREVTSGRYAEIELEALPRGEVVHRVKVLRTT